MDVDPEAHRIALPLLEGLRRSRQFSFHAVHGNFAQLPSLLPSSVGQQGVDGILMDIGVSSMQLDTAERGFRWAWPCCTKQQLHELVPAWSPNRLGMHPPAGLRFVRTPAALTSPMLMLHGAPDNPVLSHRPIANS